MTPALIKDIMLKRCKLRCRPVGHYHCPRCLKTIIRRVDLEKHLTLQCDQPKPIPPPIIATAPAAQDPTVACEKPQDSLSVMAKAPAAQDPTGPPKWPAKVTIREFRVMSAGRTEERLNERRRRKKERDPMFKRCKLHCRPVGHYHCPRCSRTIIRRVDLEKHLTLECEKPQHSLSIMAKAAAAQDPMGPSKRLGKVKLREVRDKKFFKFIFDNISKPPGEGSVASVQVSLSSVPVTPMKITPIPITPVTVTSVPVTPAPVISLPVTSIPPSTEPITSVPVTPIPLTSVPVTSVPVTPVPITSLPVTSIPPSTEPITSVPVTPIPLTSVPASNVPVTPVPSTFVPVTSLPVTPVPSTFVPPSPTTIMSAPITHAPLTLPHIPTISRVSSITQQPSKVKKTISGKHASSAPKSPKTKSSSSDPTKKKVNKLDHSPEKFNKSDHPPDPDKAYTDFTHETTLLLLELTMTHIDLYRKSKHEFYSVVNRVFQERGYSMTPLKIRKKLNNMLASYKRVLFKSKFEEGSKITWEYFFLMRDIFEGTEIGPTLTPGEITTIDSSPLFLLSSLPSTTQPFTPEPSTSRPAVYQPSTSVRKRRRTFAAAFEEHAERLTNVVESLAGKDLSNWKKQKEKRRRNYEKKMLCCMNRILMNVKEISQQQKEIITLLKHESNE